MPDKNFHAKNSQGNVLFLILIAAALFAALSYAITSANRTSGGSVSKEKARANAAAILQFTTSVKNAVMRVKLRDGCSDTTLDFSNNIYKRNNGTLLMTANSNAPSSKICHIFDSNGGSMVPVIPGPDSLDPTASQTTSLPKLGHAQIQTYQFMGVGTDGPGGTESANDILFRINYLNRETCMAINDLVGVINLGGEPPVTSNTGTVAGTYANGSLIADMIKSGPETDGHPAFCYGNSGGPYIFVHTIVER